MVLVLSAKYLTAIPEALRPPLFAFVVVATVVHPNWLVGRILEDVRLRWVGRISYSLYIWQMLFFAPHDDLGWVQSFPGAVIGTAACALLSYYFVEKPAIAFGRRIAAAWRPAFADSV